MRRLGNYKDKAEMGKQVMMVKMESWPLASSCAVLGWCQTEKYR